MLTSSRIEWTEFSWNPVTGCSKVSEGCRHCYAERMAERLRAMGVGRYANGFDLTLHPDLLNLPRRMRRPRLIFVNSMSDLFHEKVPLEFIRRVFDTMHACPRHTFQVLTKRSRRLRELAPLLILPPVNGGARGGAPVNGGAGLGAWPPHVWIGVSIEDRRVLHRVADLCAVPSPVRFLSCEPLLGLLDDLPLDGISWVIVGGESGPGARPMRKTWVESMRGQCRRADVPFFFKQWGGVSKHLTGRTLNGRTYDEMPALTANLPVERQTGPAGNGRLELPLPVLVG